MKVRVLVVDDDALLRSTLAQLLALDPEIEVAGQAANGLAGAELVEKECPHVVLMDIEMPKLDGIAATRRIRETTPGTAVVILTKFGDDENVFEAIKAGALGYVLKDAGLDEIRAAIHEAHEGGGHLNPALVARVLGEFARVSKAHQDAKALFAELTRREMEVLERLGRGLRNKQIADELCLSTKTVKTHVGAVLRKLQLNDRTEAALLAQKHGLNG